MILRAEKSVINGTITVPASKSHTVRAVAIASLAQGRSRLFQPLDSNDTRSAAETYRGFGADITDSPNEWIVSGNGQPQPCPDEIDVGNSGTTLYIAMSTAAVCNGTTRMTGDEQIRKRPARDLLHALTSLGASAESVRGNGCAPLRITGPMKGGQISIACPTSQYLTSLLLNCPLAKGDSEITVTLLNEAPYVRMTLDWLDFQHIEYEQDGMKTFRIPGNQQYRAFTRTIPGDFSSATFFICAAACTGGSITLNNLDMNDSQGDKQVADIIEAMGATVTREQQRITVTGKSLTGGEFDLNAIPDALPALAVTACFARSQTRLVNVPQARLKETDRIAVMKKELSSLGADITELPDGLIIRESELSHGSVHGHGDHRVVMAMAVAGLAGNGVEVDTAESAAVTFPDFVQLMKNAGAVIDTES